MSLVECHECGHEVSTYATACPNCGCPTQITKRRLFEVALERLAGRYHRDLYRDVARNPNVPISLLERIAGNEDVGVRHGVAWNPNAPASLLERLAGDLNSDIRRSVAENKQTPTSVLERLSNDSVVDVSIMALLNMFEER